MFNHQCMSLFKVYQIVWAVCTTVYTCFVVLVYGPLELYKPCSEKPVPRVPRERAVRCGPMAMRHAMRGRAATAPDRASTVVRRAPVPVAHGHAVVYPLEHTNIVQNVHGARRRAPCGFTLRFTALCILHFNTEIPPNSTSSLLRALLACSEARHFQWTKRGRLLTLTHYTRQQRAPFA